MMKWVVGFFLCSGLSAFAQDGAGPKDKVMSPEVEFEKPTFGSLLMDPDWWRHQGLSTTTRLGAFAMVAGAAAMVAGYDRLTTGSLIIAWVGSQIVHEAFRDGLRQVSPGWFSFRFMDTVVRSVAWIGATGLVTGLMPGLTSWKGIISTLAALYLADFLYETLKEDIFGRPRPVKKQEGVAQKIGALAD